jgi:hypothetical protein
MQKKGDYFRLEQTREDLRLENATGKRIEREAIKQTVISTHRL